MSTYLERKARENQGGSMAAQIRAEEQALIAGIRAVPKAERHRLREIPEDEAYREWNMGLAAQHLEPAGNAVEYLTEQVGNCGPCGMAQRSIGTEVPGSG